MAMPRDRDLVAQIHAIKRRVLPSGKVERSRSGPTDVQQAGVRERFRKW